MRTSILAGTLSATLTLAFLEASLHSDETWTPMYSVSIAEEPASSRSASQFLQDAVAMEFSARLDEADYLYTRSVQKACDEYGVNHPITESYRRHYRNFLFKKFGNGDTLPEMVRIEPVLHGPESLPQRP